MTPPTTRHHAFAPESARPPGETLKDQLDALGIPQADLARRTGLSTKHINQIVQGTAVLSPETALLLERVVGIRASMWNQLEASWRTHLTHESERHALKGRLGWMDRFPLGELVDRGILSTRAKTVENLQCLLTFFGVADPDVAEDLWHGYRVAFRRSTVMTNDEYATAVWLRQAELQARDVPCEPFDRAALTALLPRLRTLTLQEPATWLDRLAELCATAGVAVVHTPAMPHTRVSGATRWLTPDKVMVALTERFKKEDHFWFTVFHEFGHVLLHGKRLTFLDDTDRRNRKTPDDRSEAEADTFAADTLIPAEHRPAYRQLALKPMPFDNIHAFAARAGIAPGIVVGRLQHDKALPWTHGNGLKRAVEHPLPHPVDQRKDA